MIDRIYVIWHREDVRRRIEEGLKDFMDVPITYIRGPDGNTPEFPQWLVNNDYTPMKDWKQGTAENPEGLVFGKWHDRDHKWGEIACAIGHLSAWEQAYKDRAQFPLFLEQDAVPNAFIGIDWGDASTMIEHAIKELNMKVHPNCWDILYAGTGDGCNSESQGWKAGIHKTIFTYCLHAYILQPHSLKDILSHDFRHNLCVPDDYVPAFYGSEKVHPNLKYLHKEQWNAYNIEPMPLIQEIGDMPHGKRESDTEASEYVSDSFFIEIGTADFDTLEPLARLGWKGIFVEPIGELLNNLERFDGCIYEETAILDYIGTTNIQYYDLDWAEEWQRGVGNTDESLNNFNSNPQFKEHFRNKEVKVTTLDALIDKYDVKRIDYLKIDIEGMEYKILQDYSWRVLPKKIKCEHIHWNGQPPTPETKRCDMMDYIVMLQHLGYKITMLPEDFIAEL
jgi:FkbM family methyltransferase